MVSEMGGSMAVGAYRPSFDVGAVVAGKARLTEEQLLSYKRRRRGRNWGDGRLGWRSGCIRRITALM